METDDATLLRRYATERCDSAFAELVRRHVDLVYSAALRQLAGDAHLAKDVAQSVFCDLARKAGQVAATPVLSGWLHTSTRYAAAHAVRAEQRRRRRELDAHFMHESSAAPAHDEAWTQARPVIDAALGELPAPDRDAILLRFFESRSFAEIGARLGLQENTARMRVDRALDRLGTQLRRRGIVSTSAALGAALGTQAVSAAPPALASVLAATAVAGGTAAASGAGAAALHLMSLAKVQIGLTAAVLAGGSTFLVQQHLAAAARERENATLRPVRAEVADLRDASDRLARAEADWLALQKEAAELPALRAQAQARQARHNEKQAAVNVRALPTPARSGRSSRPVNGAVLPLSELQTPPKPLTQKQPVYPAEMRGVGIPGQAVVSFVVSAEGEVLDARVESATDESFGTAALAAVEAWTFQPGVQNGTPVNTRLRMPMVFTLNRQRTDWF